MLHANARAVRTVHNVRTALTPTYKFEEERRCILQIAFDLYSGGTAQRFSALRMF